MKSKHLLASLLVLVSSALVASANRADTDRDRKISWEEFQTLKRAEATAAGREFNETNVRMNFDDKDHDGDGFLSYREFNAHAFDPNGDRKISFEEFSAVQVRRAQRAGQTRTEESIRQLFNRRDQDGDGFLTYEDLSRRLD